MWFALAALHWKRSIVSLSWLERRPMADIALAPGRVGVYLGNRRLERSTSAMDWLNDLAQLLKESGIKGACRVVLSHRLASMHLVEPPPTRLHQAETLAWIRERLAHRFGDPARAWRLAWQPAPADESLLVSSMSQTDHTALLGVFADHGLKPVSLRPWLADACDRHWRRVARGEAWLALAEPGRLTLAALAQGRFRLVRHLPPGEAVSASLAVALEREVLLGQGHPGAERWLASIEPLAAESGDWQALAGNASGLAQMLG